jgi:hypothetical protein
MTTNLDKCKDPAKAKTMLRVAMIVAETIRELGEVPSGHLYAQLMGHMSLECYESIILGLTGAKLVKRDGSHLLRWVGPAKGVGR